MDLVSSTWSGAGAAEIIAEQDLAGDGYVLNGAGRQDGGRWGEGGTASRRSGRFHSDGLRRAGWATDDVRDGPASYRQHQAESAGNRDADP